MEDSEYDFPPDPVEGEPVIQPPLSTVPLNLLVGMPVDQLPPTQPPGGAPRSLRQAIRGVGGMLGHAAHPRTAPAVAASAAGAVRPSSRSGSGGNNVNPADELQTFAALFGSGGLPNGAFSLEEAAASITTKREPPRSGPLGGVRRARMEWTDGDVRKFYRALSQYGTDFAAIAVLFPSHTREEVKKLYRRELRRHQAQVRAALSDKQAIDIEVFSELLRERQAREAPPAKELNVEEEDMLKDIAKGAPTDAAAATTTTAPGMDTDGTVAMEEKRRTGKQRRQEPATTAPNHGDTETAKKGKCTADDKPEETYLDMATRQQQQADQSFAEAALSGGLGEFDFDEYAV